MLRIIQYFTLLAGFLVLSLGIYEISVDRAQAWTTFKEPQLAAYASLEEDEAILKELDKQTRFNSYKPLDPMFFLKPNIFQRIERR